MFFFLLKNVHRGTNISEERRGLKIAALSSLSLSAMSTQARSSLEARCFPLQVGCRWRGHVPAPVQAAQRGVGVTATLTAPHYPRPPGDKSQLPKAIAWPAPRSHGGRLGGALGRPRSPPRSPASFHSEPPLPVPANSARARGRAAEPPEPPAAGSPPHARGARGGGTGFACSPPPNPGLPFPGPGSPFPAAGGAAQAPTWRPRSPGRPRRRSPASGAAGGGAAAAAGRPCCGGSRRGWS